MGEKRTLEFKLSVPMLESLGSHLEKLNVGSLDLFPEDNPLLLLIAKAGKHYPECLGKGNF